MDRPYPVDYEHRGVNAKIDFQWGADNDLVPRSLKISVKHKDRPVITLYEKANYRSFEYAKEQGIKLARTDIDRVLGPDPDA